MILIDAFQRAIELGLGKPGDLTWLAHAHAVSGNRGLALEVLDQLKSQRKDTYISAYSIALIHAGLGESNHAIEWLELAYEERNPLLVYLNVEPDFDTVRSEPGFVSILTRMRLA